MADDAIAYIKQLKEIAPGKPWSVYDVPGATPASDDLTRGWIDKISKMHLFDAGNVIDSRHYLRQPDASGHPARRTRKLHRGRKKGLPKGNSVSCEDKKLFIKQADVYGAYLAYTDHEIGRVIQAVEDLGQLDNTLIIYISDDDGANAEGMINGTPNEFTTFNGIPVPVKDQFLWYEFWGSARPFRTSPPPGRGQWTHPSSGPNRWRRTSAGPHRACACPGPATSQT